MRGIFKVESNNVSGAMSDFEDRQMNYSFGIDG
jgi:hypothetical protein